MTPTSTIEPFRIDVPRSVLDDLHARIDRTRWPDEPPDAGEEDYGPALARVRRLAEYWRHGYDWREVEAEFNAYPQFTTVIDGLRVHFLHVRSPREDALPLVLTHGWPGSIVEFLDVIEPLSAHFHLVIPSLPGWSFTGPAPERGWNVERTARAWAELMHRLGYERYGAQGGDWGASVSRALSEIDAEHVVAIHLNYLPTPPPPGEQIELSADDRARVEQLRHYLANQPGMRVINGTRPRTVSYAFADSPTGLLAWILDAMVQWAGSDFAISDDRVLTNVMLHWLAGSVPRLHRESNGPQRFRTRQPVGVAVLPEDITRPVRAFAERSLPIARWTEFDRGGHFAGLEAPDLLAADIREFFLGLPVS